MAIRDRSHLIVQTPPTSEPYTSTSGGGTSHSASPVVNRRAHVERLAKEYEVVLLGAEERGVTVSFESFPDLSIALESLEPLRSGEQPELLSVKTKETVAGLVQVATVYIPDGKKQLFFTQLNAYAASVDLPNARRAKLVEGIHSIRKATVFELWTDADADFPSDPDLDCWWEVWLRRSDGRSRERFASFADEHRLRTSRHYLGFGDRIVVLLHASVSELANAVGVLDDIAELRRPHEVATVFTTMDAAEQSGWTRDLLGRLSAAPADAPAVCVLDTGVQGGHVLLQASLRPEDRHAVDPLWRIEPRDGHGTEMAGLALYGDLQSLLLDDGPIELGHRLESVKILPDTGDNDPDLYGAITAMAVDRPEIEAPARGRVFMLAVTDKTPLPAQTTAGSSAYAGRPTSWSATVDALSYGRAVDLSSTQFTYLDRDEPKRPRLFVVSAGNFERVDLVGDYLDRCDVEAVQDPAQSWNALTVGAYAHSDDMSIAPPGFDGYQPIAPRGDLAPDSTTSILFDKKKWPFKPDVVAAGGNLAASPDKSHVDSPENLAILTTRMQRLGEGPLTTTRATSAATAQVAAIAAATLATYPDLRPETIRALIVHSAEWTEPMRKKFLRPQASKGELANLVRRYGMGVPDLARAVRSAADALTLVSEARIRPFTRVGAQNKGKTREMNLHELPWPTVELEALGGAEVKLRVTLSYFVEPNPSSRGWNGRYAYPSHGLRFAVRRPEENVDAFRARINSQAQDESFLPAGLGRDPGWLFGINQQQSPGSLHTDIWTGSAADLASKGAIAVYPVAGWWRYRTAFDQSDAGVDYSLVVSIESPEVEVDLWTAVANQIKADVRIQL